MESNNHLKEIKLELKHEIKLKYKSSPNPESQNPKKKTHSRWHIIKKYMKKLYFKNPFVFWYFDLNTNKWTPVTWPPAGSASQHTTRSGGRGIIEGGGGMIIGSTGGYNNGNRWSSVFGIKQSPPTGCVYPIDGTKNVGKPQKKHCRKMVQNYCGKTYIQFLLGLRHQKQDFYAVKAQWIEKTRVL